MTTEVHRTPSTIRYSCTVCLDKGSKPNKGLGRAHVAAWMTRHQHPEENK